MASSMEVLRSERLLAGAPALGDVAHGPWRAGIWSNAQL
jgi:hypothetical protein